MYLRNSFLSIEVWCVFQKWDMNKSSRFTNKKVYIFNQLRPFADHNNVLEKQLPLHPNLNKVLMITTRHYRPRPSLFCNSTIATSPCHPEESNISKLLALEDKILFIFEMTSWNTSHTIFLTFQQRFQKHEREHTQSQPSQPSHHSNLIPGACLFLLVSTEFTRFRPGTRFRPWTILLLRTRWWWLSSIQRPQASPLGQAPQDARYNSLIR